MSASSESPLCVQHLVRSCYGKPVGPIDMSQYDLGEEESLVREDYITSSANNHRNTSCRDRQRRLMALCRYVLIMLARSRVGVWTKSTKDGHS